MEMAKKVRSSPGIGLWIHVTPRARRPGVGGQRGDALCVAVQAQPVDGKANAACVAALAAAFGVPKARVQLDPAARGRRKRVQILGEPAVLKQRLNELAGPGGLG